MNAHTFLYAIAADDQHRPQFLFQASCFVALIDVSFITRLYSVGHMNTLFLLMAQYGGKAIISVEDVSRDYFCHLNATKLVQKISTGEIAIPLVRIEASQKCAKGIHLTDLANYLDARVEEARKEMAALTS